MANSGSNKPRVPNGAVGDLARAQRDAALDASKLSEATESAARLLRRLESGEITRDAYLDLRIEEAIAPFAKHLGHNQVEFMRLALRDQLESDPALVELVRRATGVSDPG